ITQAFLFLMAYLPNFEIVSLRLIARHLQLEMHSDHVNNASYNSLLSMGRCPGSLLNFFRFLPSYSFEASGFFLFPFYRFFSLFYGLSAKFLNCFTAFNSPETATGNAFGSRKQRLIQ